MEAKVKPIPAFYCCYLLRSTVRHASLYIGSSPHPARRLAQHNGQVKGGAVRTSRLSLRPWEMTCVVAGFPSNIAALQFEWAWQNAHLTRHILPEERISFPVTLTKTNARTGKSRKKPGRPRTSLVERLSNLHLLLRTNYFSQWPLELRFFREDVFRSWQSWCARIDAQLRSTIKVTLDLAQIDNGAEEFSSAQQPAKRKKADRIGKGGVEGVDPTYARYRDVFEKGQFVMDEDDEHSCDVCNGNIDLKTDLFALCAATGCTSMSHVTCLSDKFLRDSASSPQLLPSKGCCPSCGSEHEWSDLMRPLSLRLRGEKEIQKLLKKGRTPAAIIAAEMMEENESEEDNDLNDDEEMVGNAGISNDDLNAHDELLDDDDDDEDDDTMSVASHGSTKSTTIASGAVGQNRNPPHRLEIVIEDSEDERWY